MKRQNVLSFVIAAITVFFLLISPSTVIGSSPHPDPLPLQKAQRERGNLLSSNVGTLTGNFQVTPTGQAHYSIPIDVPPGTAKMQPALAITYDSSSSNTRNGLLGMGFSLDGLSAITRCPSNKTQNGVIHGVDFSYQDRFCLNGEQLVAVKGVYGADGTEYRTYIDSQAKIVSYGQAGNGPASFKVWTKGGQVATYGGTAESQIYAQGKPTIATWALSQITDTVGNYLTVTYNNDGPNGAFYVTRIDYTGNTPGKMSPYNSIFFEYENRPDKIEKYCAGSVVRVLYRLKAIYICANVGGKSQVISTYHINYEISKNTYRSRITSIQKCAADGVCLPATKFEWQTNSEGWDYAPQYIPPDYIANNGGDGNPNGMDNGMRFIDLLGNGVVGIAQSVYWNSTNIRKGAWINNGHGWEYAPQFIPPDYIANNAGDGHPHGMDNGIRFVDLIGNGIMGIVQSVYWSNTNIRKGAWINRGNGWEYTPQYIPPDYIANNAGDGDPQGMDNGIRFVDLLGNGVVGIVQSVYWNSTNIRNGAWINNIGYGWEYAPQFIPPDYIANNCGGGQRQGMDQG